MAARFIIGLAGTGKTSYCANALAQASQADPLGPPLFWLVPQQATFMSEQRLLTHLGQPGAFRVQVLAFDRFCRTIAAELGLNSTLDVSGITRMLLLAQAVDHSREKLVLFQQVAQEPGFLQKLDAILRELQQAGHDTLSLNQVRRTLQARNQADSILDRKLQDFTTLLGAWQNRLGANQYDPDRLPQLIADRLAKSATMAAARVWLDSFSALSMVEINLITALAQCSQSVEITILADPESPVFHSPDAPLQPMSTFHRTEVMYRRLLGAFANARVTVEPPVLLTQPHRFAAAPTMLSLTRQLFWPPTESPATHTTPAAPSTTAALWECDTPESEIRAAAEFIREQTTGHKLRYRDIGIVVADIDSYEPTIRRIFAAHNIPHFIDRRRPITHHPLVELLRSAVNLVKDNFRQADWLALLKTGLANLSAKDAFILENYLLTHGIDRDDFSRPWTWTSLEPDENAPLVAPDSAALAALNQANNIRHTVHQSLSDWITQASAATSHALKIRALRNLLATLCVRAGLQAWIDDASTKGQPEIALIHQQAWQETLKLLEVIEKLSANGPGTLKELAVLLNAGLETLTLGLIPPALDQVLVSSAHRSRHPELHTVIVMGSIETRFPQVLPEDPMLDDRQRELFNATGNAPIGGGSRQDFLEAPFFDYVAFTRAARQLIISYPGVNTDGAPVIASQYVLKLKGPLPVRQINAGNNNLRHWSCRDDLLTGIMDWLGFHAPRQSASATPGPSLTLPQVHALYQWLTVHAERATRSAAHQAFAALRPRAAAQLAPELARLLHPGELHISASQLESFCRCPQQYFFQHTLRLQPRRTPDMDALAIGQVYHQALQEVFTQIITGNLPWPQCSHDALLAVLDEKMEAAFRAVETKFFARSPQSLAMRRPVRRNLAAFLTREHLAAQTSQLRPHQVELAFGLDSTGLPPLKLTGRSGTAIAISGKIDRLDVANDGRAIVLDYKSGNHAFNLDHAKSGIDIQLLVYLLALQHDEKALNGKPYHGFGAFYQPLIFKPKHPAPPDPDDPAHYAILKPTGFFRLEDFPLLEPRPAPGARAKWYSLAINKDGKVSALSKGAITDAELQRRLGAAKDLITTVAEDIAAGHIQPHPFQDGAKSACKLCDFQPACPFDRLTGRYHNIRQQPGPPGPTPRNHPTHQIQED